MHVPSPQSRLKLGLNGRRRSPVPGLPRQIRAGDSRQSEQVPIGQELLLLEQEEKRGDWPARKGEERIRAAAQFMREQPCSGKGGAPLWGRAQGEGLVEALPRGFDGEHFGEDATMEPRLQLVATAVQPVLEDGSGPQDEWSDGTRNTDVVFHPGPRLARA